MTSKKEIYFNILKFEEKSYIVVCNAKYCVEIKMHKQKMYTSGFTDVVGSYDFILLFVSVSHHFVKNRQQDQ